MTVISLHRSADGTWRCSHPRALELWLQRTTPAQIGYRIEAFIDHRYKHLGEPSDVERAWAALSEDQIYAMLRGCLETLSEGVPWREPAGTPLGGVGLVLRWVLPENMRVNGEAGLAPAPAVGGPLH